MRCLLDTHILLWMYMDSEKLGPKIKKILSDDTNLLYFSSLSLWEISLKFGLGKLDLINWTPDSLRMKILADEIEEIPFLSRIASSYQRLPQKANHRDPFDRMLIWQAIQGDFVLVTRDEKMKQYAEDGLKLLD